MNTPTTFPDKPNKIERAKQEWEATADALPQLVCLLDDQRRVLRTNRTVERWGLARVTEVKGLEIHRLLHPHCDDPTCYQIPFWDQAWSELSSGRSFEREVQDEVLDRHLHVQVRPIASPVDQKPEATTTFAAVVIHDVTERVQAEQALRRYADEQATLYAITSAVTTSLDPDELLSTVLDVVLPALNASAGWITMTGSLTEDSPRVAFWRQTDDRLLKAEQEILQRDCPVCVSQREPSQSYPPTLVYECPRLSHEALEVTGLSKPICIPLTSASSNESRAGGRVLGTLSVAWRTPRPNTPEEKDLLTTIGQQIGLALHNAQLYQTARQVDRLQVINRLDRALAATLDSQKVAEITLRQIASALEAPKGTLLLCAPHTDQKPEPPSILTEGWTEPALSRQDQEQLEISLHRLRERQEVKPLSRRELDTLVADLDHPLIQGWGSGSLVIPIWSKKELVAVLALDGRPPDNPFNDSDRVLAQAAASRAGQAIHNARLYDELKALLRERERTQAQLIHAEKMSALGRLVASITHEINNPLQSLQGLLTLSLEELETDTLTDENLDTLSQFLHIAESEIARLANIVRRMRDFYRPVHGGLEPTDVHAVLQSVLELTAKQLQHSSVTIERCWAKELPAIQSNSDHLKQVFLNLTINAIDAMPEGGTLKVITAPDKIQDRPAVRVEFSDTGVGMAPEIQARLFEPFFTTKEQGSGLGLSTSYGIIEAHNGQITVTSQEGVGTTFIILLPVSPDQPLRL